MNLKKVLDELTTEFDRYRWSIDTVIDTLLVGEGPDNTVTLVCSDSGQAQLLLQLLSRIILFSSEYNGNLKDIELMDAELDTVGNYLEYYHSSSYYPRGKDTSDIKNWLEEVLEDQREYLRDELDEVYCNKVAAEDELEAVTERNSDLEIENDDLRDTVENLKQQLQELEEELNELRAAAGARDNLAAGT